LGTRQHEAGMVTIVSTKELKKQITFRTNRWAYFIAYSKDVDVEAKELNKNTGDVAFCAHLSNGYYISMTSGWKCVDFRRWYVLYGLDSSQIRPSQGLTTLCLKKTTLTLHIITSMHINQFW